MMMMMMMMSERRLDKTTHQATSCVAMHKKYIELIKRAMPQTATKGTNLSSTFCETLTSTGACS
jgi:hypothetical protein